MFLIRRKSRDNAFPRFALLVSVIGFSVCYLIPFVTSAVYAFVNNPIQKKFVGFKNFIALFQNSFFLDGLRNTSLFMLFSIPLGMVTSLLLALVLQRYCNGGRFFLVLFLVPMVIPSAAVVDFWAGIFDKVGMLNGDGAFLLIVLIYVWKNLGYNTVLFLAGLSAIPQEYYQCAAVFGANSRQCFWKITMVYLTPAFFMTFLMSFVNSFKIFREVYLIWHEYPPENVYLLQHFVNSTLLSMHYEKLVSAVYVLTAGIVLFVLAAFYLEGKFYRKLEM